MLGNLITDVSLTAAIAFLNNIVYYSFINLSIRRTDIMAHSRTEQPGTTEPTLRNRFERSVTTKAAALALAVAALAGCAPTGATEPTSTPTSVETSTPAPTPTPSETEKPPVVDLEAIKQELAPYEAMSVAEFKVLPENQHNEFTALIIKRDMATFVAEWVGTMNKMQTKQYTVSELYPVAAPDNSAQDIANLIGWETRLIYNLEGDEREKYRLAVHHDGSNSQMYINEQSTSDSFPSKVKPGILAYKDAYPQAVADESASGSLKTDDGGQKFRDIVTTDTGAAYTTRAYYQEVTILGNETVKYWHG